MQEKQSLWQAFRLKRVLAANLTIFSLVIWGLSGQVVQSRATQSQIGVLEHQSQALQTKNTEIAELGKRFASTGMAEREARTKLNLQKPGESVIIVRNDVEIPDEAAMSQGANGPGQSDDISNPQKWRRFFFH